MVDSKEFTRAEVTARDGRGDSPLWIIVKDSVYDVTSYVNEHPGGVEPVRENAGKDATRDFADAGHSGDAKSILAKYKVGELVQADRQYDANGKKIKQVPADSQKQNTSRSFINIITCGLVG